MKPHLVDEERAKIEKKTTSINLKYSPKPRVCLLMLVCTRNLIVSVARSAKNYINPPKHSAS